MAYHKDFHQYLEALEQQGKLNRIKREINKDTQLHPLVRLQYRGLAEDEYKAFLFENVIGSKGQKYKMPVAVAAIAGSTEILAIGMMCQTDEITEKIIQAELNPIEPRLVNTGPVQEEIHLGENLLEHGGLDEFPIPVTTPGYDVAPYITAACVVTKDPETGVPNIGMYRIMLKSPTRTGISWMPNQGALFHWRKCRQMGIPLEAAIVIGGPPNVAYVAVTKFPMGMNEFTVAGSIAGEPMEVIKCQTVNLEVPANAEIVIEGEVSITELEPECPFGESPAFIGMSGMRPCFNVKCITHRKRPVWVATISQYASSEASQLLHYTSEASILKHLKYDLNMSQVVGVAMYASLGAACMVAIKLKKTEPVDVQRILEAAASRSKWAKLFVAVDEDVNIKELDSVILATCMRAQPHLDFSISRSIVPVENLADNQVETVETSQLLIDATMKRPYPPISLPKKEFMDEAWSIWQEEGLPKLNLKEPWWGVNLGFWSDEDEELARAAVEGDYYKAGERYAQRKQTLQG
jgi:4-hydroxy-3-polyprenylbenzoate decarboxylase